MKEPVSKNHTFYDFSYTNTHKEKIIRNRKQTGGCQGLQGGEFEDQLLNGYMIFFGVMNMLWN